MCRLPSKKRTIMKEFDIDYNNLYEHAENPYVYLPYADTLIGHSSNIVATWAEGEYYFEDGFDIEEYVQSAYMSDDERYAKDIAAYKKEVESDEDLDFDSHSFYDYLWGWSKLDEYYEYALDDLGKNLVAVSIHERGFGCGGGPYTDTLTFIIEDADGKLSSLSEEEFLEKIVERVNLVPAG